MRIIPPREYYANKSLTKFILPAGCTEICEGAFATSSLSEIEFPNTVRLIRKYAFAGLLNLTELVIPEGVTQIGEMAFTGCMQLKRVSLPDTLEHIGRNIFYGCHMLERIEVSQHVCKLLRKGNADVLELCVIRKEEAEIEEQPEIKEVEIEAQPEIKEAEIEAQPEIKEAEIEAQPEIKEAEIEAQPEIEEQPEIKEVEIEAQPEMEDFTEKKTNFDEYDAENAIADGGFNVDALINQISTEGDQTNTIAEYMGYDAEELTEDLLIPLGVLGLSRRAYNCLKHEGCNDLLGVLRMSGKALLQTRNLGKKSMAEILNKAYEILERSDVPAVNNCSENAPQASQKPLSIKLDSLIHSPHLSYLETTLQRIAPHAPADDRQKLFGKMLALWCDMAPIPEEIQAFERALTSSALYLQLQKAQIEDLLRASHNYGMTETEIAEELAPQESEMDVSSLLNQMLEEGTLRRIKGKYVLRCITLQEYLGELQEERTYQCVKKRLQGETLQGIAEETGITRERVRQICNRVFRKLCNAEDALYEYCYVPLYQKYNASPEEIRVIFSEDAMIVEYLRQWGKRGDLPLEEAVEDETLTKDMREKIAEYVEDVDDGTIVLDGETYPRTRKALMEYVMKKCCVDAMDVDEYVDTYNGFLRAHALDEAGLRIMKDNRRYIDSHLADSDKVLWSLNRRLRYYDIAARDYRVFFDTIQLHNYHNIEISTRLLMRLHPAVMHQYDIRDEYELHNLLKKLHAEEKYPSMEFLRMPMVRFGRFDRDAFVLETLIECAPCDKDTLVKEIENKTGVLPETIGAVWTPCLNDYYHMGVYSIDAPAMPSGLMQAMKAALPEEAYTMDEVRDIYRRVSQGMDEKYLCPYNLKQLGFNVYTKLVIVNTESANSYFTRKFTQEDIVDNTLLQKRFGGITTYSGILNKLKNTYEIIEFAPNQLISIRKLRSFGIDKAQLHAFCDAVEQITKTGELFSMHSLRKQGAEFALDALGFDDMFLESILKEDDRFRYGRFNGSTVFAKMEEGDHTPLNRGDLLKWMMRDCKSVDIDDLIDDIREQYGCTLDRTDIQNACIQAHYYWNAIMERVYVNYEVYYDEV